MDLLCLASRARRDAWGGDRARCRTRRARAPGPAAWPPGLLPGAYSPRAVPVRPVRGRLGGPGGRGRSRVVVAGRRRSPPVAAGRRRTSRTLPDAAGTSVAPALRIRPDGPQKARFGSFLAISRRLPPRSWPNGPAAGPNRRNRGAMRHTRPAAGAPEPQAETSRRPSPAHAATLPGEAGHRRAVPRSGGPGAAVRPRLRPVAQGLAGPVRAPGAVRAGRPVDRRGRRGRRHDRGGERPPPEEPARRVRRHAPVEREPVHHDPVRPGPGGRRPAHPGRGPGRGQAQRDGPHGDGPGRDDRGPAHGPAGLRRAAHGPGLARLRPLATAARRGGVRAVEHAPRGPRHRPARHPATRPGPHEDPGHRWVRPRARRRAGVLLRPPHRLRQLRHPRGPRLQRLVRRIARPDLEPRRDPRGQQGGGRGRPRPRREGRVPGGVHAGRHPRPAPRPRRPGRDLPRAGRDRRVEPRGLRVPRHQHHVGDHRPADPPDRDDEGRRSARPPGRGGLPRDRARVLVHRAAGGPAAGRPRRVAADELHGRVS